MRSIIGPRSPPKDICDSGSDIEVVNSQRGTRVLQRPIYMLEGGRKLMAGPGNVKSRPVNGRQWRLVFGARAPVGKVVWTRRLRPRICVMLRSPAWTGMELEAPTLEPRHRRAASGFAPR